MACWLLLIFVVAIASDGVLGAPPSFSGRIIGGKEISIDKVPYQVSMQYDGLHICGGSAVAPRIVLTASHCCIGTTAPRLSVRAASEKLEDGGIVFPVTQMVMHPNYNDSNLDYDVCILRIRGTFLNKPNITIVPLPRTGLVPSGEVAIVSGWGAMETGGNAAPYLRAVNVRILPIKECYDRTTGLVPMTERMMCSKTNGRSFCVGDSGGPLVYNGTQIGIVSFVISECGGFTPSMYARVSNRNVTAFINEHIEADQRRMALAKG